MAAGGATYGDEPLGTVHSAIGDGTKCRRDVAVVPFTMVWRQARMGIAYARQAAYYAARVIFPLFTKVFSAAPIWRIWRMQNNLIGAK